MIKNYFLIAIVFIFVACGNDTEELNSTFASTETSESANTPFTHTAGGDYDSPWEDINNRIPVAYIFQPGGANNHGVYIRITPFIGLAYYDGADDGIYNAPTGPINLASGAYPALYANGQEYGNYIAANPIILNNHPTYPTHELVIFSKEDHCPLVNVGVGINYNLGATRFDVVNNSTVQPAMAYGYPGPVLPPATVAEEDLLREYGKVMYYRVEFGLDAFNFTHEEYVLSLEVPDVYNPAEWDEIPDLINVGSAFKDSFGNNMHYHIGLSKEIVIDKDNVGWKANELRSTGATGKRMFTTEYNHSWGMFTPNPTSNIAIKFY